MQLSIYVWSLSDNTKYTDFSTANFFQMLFTLIGLQPQGAAPQKTILFFPEES